MAYDSPKVIKMARILAISHIIVGALLLGFGIADLVVEYFWTGNGYFGIWAGMWMCIAGGLGIPGTLKERSTSRNAFAGIFLGFSIISAVLGGIIIICYSLAIAFYRNEYIHNIHYDPEPEHSDLILATTYSRHKLYGKDMTYSVAIMILGSVELVIGIWVAVSICLMKPCDTLPQQGQVMYTSNNGYIMTQGGPVAIPMQTVTSEVQEDQPRMVMVPLYGVEDCLPQSTNPSSATRYQPQHIQVAPVRTMATGNQSQRSRFSQHTNRDGR